MPDDSEKRLGGVQSEAQRTLLQCGGRGGRENGGGRCAVVVSSWLRRESSAVVECGGVSAKEVQRATGLPLSRLAR